MKKKQGKVRLAFWLPADSGEWVQSERVKAGQSLSEWMRRLVEAARKAKP
jgi:hypothetical protein